MKKNRMMRLASGLLVLCLLTTCTISGTFAKYVTKSTGTDTARVAKFGVAVTANGETFKDTYAKDNNSFTLAANTVVSTDKVVAPGTEGSMASMSLSGTPEVAVHVSYKGTFDISNNWTVNEGTFYCPLIITINNTETIKGTDYSTADAFESAVNGKIDAYSKDYAAGTDLNTVFADSLSVKWEWPFETTLSGVLQDEKDTWLGNQAAAGNPATVTLTIETTVTQID